MQGRLAPSDPDELERALEAGHDLEKKLELDDMVWGERFIFVLTGVTDGLLVRGIAETPEGLEIQSFLLDSELDEGHILDVRVEREN
jgi:fructose-1,6-bisphosphatase II